MLNLYLERSGSVHNEGWILFFILKQVSEQTVCYAVAVQTHKGKNVTSLPYCCVLCFLPTRTDGALQVVIWQTDRRESRQRAEWAGGLRFVNKVEYVTVFTVFRQVLCVSPVHVTRCIQTGYVSLSYSWYALYSDRFCVSPLFMVRAVFRQVLCLSPVHDTRCIQTGSVSLPCSWYALYSDRFCVSPLFMIRAVFRQVIVGRFCFYCLDSEGLQPKHSVLVAGSIPGDVIGLCLQ